MAEILPCLARGADELGLDLGAGVLPGLVAYVRLLMRWNGAYNLTSVREPQEVARRHVLDCLAILPYLRGTRLLDLGTGAGLPGLILAIARPEMECALLDGNGKKTRFCTQAVMELALPNVRILHVRTENYRPQAPFSTITARAFGPLSALREHAGRLLAPGGCLLAMKGTRRELAREMAGLEQGAERRPEVVTLGVPGLAAHRHLVILERPSPKPANT
uniref:Ribosomal RNA small subunit methyltransferase G n=1 Tax=Candidatus Kentrum sp. MB TaxID=2138164 RepID=A0A450XU69_9GAMM|nr:MAG: 16S rRNA m(7)G-527 methyltransferase [Candidatus Kentron sp. MB]